MGFSYAAGVMIAALAIIFLPALLNRRRGESAEKNISWLIVTGLVTGTLVGGVSTIGTAQLAYTYGLTAWWYTLGAGAACAVNALVFIEPLRRKNKATLSEIITGEYGSRAGFSSALLSSVGMLINIISQLISASAIIFVVFPSMSNAETILVSGAIMILYAALNNTRGTGVGGLIKCALLFAAMIACGLLALDFMGGLSGTAAVMSAASEETGVNYFSIFARGVLVDAGGGVSLILGVVTTQTYFQAAISAKSLSHARGGFLFSAFLCPFLGIFGIIVGLYMRSVTDPGSYVAKTALTDFILNYSGMPAILAGLCLGALFIACVGTSAGVALGISSVIQRDIIRAKDPSGHVNSMSQIRVIKVLVIAAATLISCSPIGDTILSFAFLSMGFRGCAIFAPLCFAVWARGRVPGRYAVFSIILGSLTTFVFGTLDLFGVLSLPFDAVFPGVIIGTAIMFAGYFKSNEAALSKPPASF